VRFLKACWKPSKSVQPPAPSQRAALQAEALESRELLSASPLPVLMVLPNRDFYYSEYSSTRPALDGGEYDIATGSYRSAGR
jgi:hypothetical protein